MQGQGARGPGPGLVLPQPIYEAVIAHCRRGYPKEACGILAGVGAFPQPRDAAVITQAYPMTNVEDSPIGYALDPKEQLLIEKQMRQRHQRMLGIYHSHTASDAYPSSVDVSLALSPDISYVLVSLKHLERPVLKSYRIDGAVIAEERVMVDASRPVGTA